MSEDNMETTKGGIIPIGWTEWLITFITIAVIVGVGILVISNVQKSLGNYSTCSICNQSNWSGLVGTEGVRLNCTNYNGTTFKDFCYNSEWLKERHYVPDGVEAMS